MERGVDWRLRARTVLSQVQLTRVAARAARLWPPGPFALGQAAAGVAAGVLRSERRAFSVLTVLSGEFGVRDVWARSR